MYYYSRFQLLLFIYLSLWYQLIKPSANHETLFPKLCFPNLLPRKQKCFPTNSSSLPTLGDMTKRRFIANNCFLVCPYVFKSSKHVKQYVVRHSLRFKETFIQFFFIFVRASVSDKHCSQFARTGKYDTPFDNKQCFRNNVSKFAKLRLIFNLTHQQLIKIREQYFQVGETRPYSDRC